MTGESIVFWIVVAITLGSGAVVVTSQNLIYSAVSLLFTFMGVAGLYVFMMADFLAATQVMIYVGGILVLIIFGIMLTHRITTVHISHTTIQRGAGGVVVSVILLGLIWMIQKTPWLLRDSAIPTGTTSGIGKLLMIDYLLPFEVASVLLLAALIGAAMLSRRGD